VDFEWAGGGEFGSERYGEFGVERLFAGENEVVGGKEAVSDGVFAGLGFACLRAGSAARDVSW